MGSRELTFEEEAERYVAEATDILPIIRASCVPKSGEELIERGLRIIDKARAQIDDKRAGQEAYDALNDICYELQNENDKLRAIIRAIEVITGKNIL